MAMSNEQKAMIGVVVGLIILMIVAVVLYMVRKNKYCKNNAAWMAHKKIMDSDPNTNGYNSKCK